MYPSPASAMPFAVRALAPERCFSASVALPPQCPRALPDSFELRMRTPGMVTTMGLKRLS